jgi:Pyruvate/2-oxoacid:ferredoxin oxidoreductase delta subunit
MIENSFGQQQEQTRENNRAQVTRQGAIAGADPWEYRNKSMKCMTCIWYIPKQRIGTSNSDINPLAEIGRCRRHAPTMGGYPVVYMTDWCGDHRIDENKV